MLELLSFLCRWIDWREKGRKCGQMSGIWLLISWKILQFSNSIHAIWCTLYWKSINLFKIIVCFYHIPPYSSRCQNYGREKSVRSLGADRGCLRGMCPSEAENFHTFRTQFTRFHVYFLSTFQRKKKKKGRALFSNVYIALPYHNWLLNRPAMIKSKLSTNRITFSFFIMFSPPLGLCAKS